LWTSRQGTAEAQQLTLTFVDTSSEVATGIGIAATGTILAALVTGSLSSPSWSVQQAATFQTGVSVAGLVLTAVAAALVVFGIVRSRSEHTGGNRAS
jgi:hypothetical protein